MLYFRTLTPTVTKDLTIQNRLGLHARPSAMFVKTCNRFKCEIWVEKDGEKVNGKSIMGLMMLGAAQGGEIIIHVEGEQAELAIEKLVGLVVDGFGED